MIALGKPNFCCECSDMRKVATRRFTRNGFAVRQFFLQTQNDPSNSFRRDIIIYLLSTLDRGSVKI